MKQIFIQKQIKLYNFKVYFKIQFSLLSMVQPSITCSRAWEYADKERQGQTPSLHRSCWAVSEGPAEPPFTYISHTKHPQRVSRST